MLAIEVLSPSARSSDLHLKKDRFRRAGFAHHRVVTPETPSVGVPQLDGEGDGEGDGDDATFEGDDATFELVGECRGDESLSVEYLFPLTVVPRLLVEH